MLLVPGITPVTTPEPTPIVATEGVLLVQEPPVSASVRVVVPPDAQTESVPPIAAGVG